MSPAIFHHTLVVSSTKRPAPLGAGVPMNWMALMMPMSMPDATMAGMMGTNTSESTLMARMKPFCCWAAASLASALLAAEMLPCLQNSSYTLSTVPVP